MPFQREPSLLQGLAKSVVAEPALRAGMAEVKYEDDELKADIEARADSIWEVASDEIRRFDQGERDLERLKAQADQDAAPRPAFAQAPSSALIGWTGGILALYVFVMLGWGVVQLLQDWRTALSSWWIFLLLLVIPAVGFVGLIAFLVGREEKRQQAWDAQRKALDQDWESKLDESRVRLGIDSVEAALKARHETIHKLLVDRVKQVVVEAINARTTDSFDTRLEVRRPRGFGEVFNARFAVQTRSRGRLQNMLETMPGGSIGIAGSRGAGKSTLLKLYCGPRRVVEMLNGRPVLGVLVSAPVAYQARDFILYLFSTVCQQTIEAEGEHYQSPAAPTDAPAAPRIDASLQQLLRPLPLLLIRTAFWLLLLCFFTAVMLAALQSYQEPTTKPTTAARAASAPSGAAASSAPVSGASASASSASGSASGASASASEASTATARASAPAASAPGSATRPDRSAPEFSAFLHELVLLLKIDPATWLGWSIVLLVAGSFLAELLRFGAFRMYRLALAVTVRQCFGWFRFVDARAKAVQSSIWAQINAEMAERQRALSQDSPPNAPYGSDLANRAAAWLKLIKFQQSYTSGWSGALKLPIGLEGGINRAVTLAQNQLSLPEIVHFLAEFIEKVSMKYQVIIGIDELDKLQTDEQAQQFLNDVKAIFGLERCFYLITVSEDAMTSFERRGLKFRDVFDSAFDDFIYIDHLKFDSARRLLQQRVVGRPIPFFALSYCMSGGLPRDLIRSFRDVMEAGAEGGASRELGSICARLVSEDLLGKVRAIRSSLRKSNAEASVGEFPDVLYEIEDAVADDDRLAMAIGRLAALASAARTEAKAKAATPVEAKVDAAPVLDLIDELATYLCFGVALRQFFNNHLTAAMLTKPGGGCVDALARARRMLGSYPTMARTLIDAFRAAQSMAKFPAQVGWELDETDLGPG